MAEDLDYDSSTKRFFITSVLEKKIIATEIGGRSSDFAHAPDGWPMLAVKVDARHRLLWATEVAMQGFDSAPKSDWGKSAIVGYDLENGKLFERVEGPVPSALGDLVLTPEGDVIASDGNGGGVYRLARNSAQLERLDKGDFISPQTPAIHPDGRHIFVPDYARGIAVLEPATKQVYWLSMAGRFALNGIDGLYFEGGQLIAVQNGTSPERVIAFTLNPSLTGILAETVIERSTQTLGDPTHGVVIDKCFFYIANSGWEVVDDHGNLKNGLTRTVPRIMQVPLRVLRPAPKSA